MHTTSLNIKQTKHIYVLLASSVSYKEKIPNHHLLQQSNTWPECQMLEPIQNLQALVHHSREKCKHLYKLIYVLVNNFCIKIAALLTKLH